MTKIMLVEDDKSPREIYGVRLLAEGYDIVSAGDGEEALAIAIKERPVLIVTDVMMPKISGFDMLDILRSTTETRDIKVIMMTALSSEEHRKRGEAMGADRYLVKSQVGIEDVVRVVHEVLGDQPTAGAQPAAPAAAPVAAPQPAPAPAPRAATPPAVPPRPVAQPAPQQPAPAPAPQQLQTPQASTTTPAAPSTRQRIIQPLNDPTGTVDINDLLNREMAKEAGAAAPQIPTVQQERAQVQSQLNNLAPPAAPPAPNLPNIAIDAQGRVSPQPPTTGPQQAGPGLQVPPRPPQQ